MVVEMIRAGGRIVLKKIQELFIAVLGTETVPKEWRKCHHYTNFQEGRQARPRQLQTHQLILSHIYK